MTNNEFDELISKFNTFWNDNIVTAYIQIKTHLLQGLLNNTSNRLFNCIQHYSNVITLFVEEAEATFAKYTLTKKQQIHLLNYLNECRQTRTADTLELKRIESALRKGQLLPLPTFEEQSLSGQIFPDNPIYLEVNFEENGNTSPTFSA
ncbi:hypothetical protein DIZ81_08080 [Legionella taurinensis]|uniref:Uncharacterized protein n=1 Tax=Legionella taurinensis TaxID=70611 RepID=A0A3A5L725_9GAMM|nr:hypothetical protein [Legionella taurinensis]MDX1837672.1 hypothetical protein [Legionella taurinensis]PUT39957.1 hypothetical protein DB744_08080 [Legionella taurinensis]PUT43723.1 hypothetical protein DB746_05405 [Legionella taurinensis]PUT46144.1 hypothetical protein DB743_05345 [Legionella taurinensis]PUT47878.1 hypothetical protein DB745_06485 [Legionella taurinensis]